MSGGTITGTVNVNNLQSGYNSVKTDGFYVGGSFKIRAQYSDILDIFKPGTGTSGVVLEISTYKLFRPMHDNYVNLGWSSYRWDQVYAVNGAISTSDRREKCDISYIGSPGDYDTAMSNEQLFALMMGIKCAVFKRKDGEGKRPHHGLIAQDFEDLMREIGLKDHAGFIKSPKTREVEIEDKNGEKRIEHEVVEGEYVYGFRYEELITDILRFCQLQQRQIDEQADEIKEIKLQLQEIRNILIKA